MMIDLPTPNLSTQTSNGEVSRRAMKKTVANLQQPFVIGFVYPRWWQLKYVLCSPRKLGKMNPFGQFADSSDGLGKNPPTSIP